MKYPKRSFNKEEAKRLSSSLLETALDFMSSEPVFQMNTPLVKRTKELGSKLAEQKNEQRVELYFQKVTGKLWKKVVSEVRGKSWTEESKLSMWQHFHMLRTQPALANKWKTLLDEIGAERNARKRHFSCSICWR